MYFLVECLKFAISSYIYGRLYSPVCLGVSSFKFSNAFNCLLYELYFSLRRDFYSIAYGILALAIFNYRLTDSFSLVESWKPSPQLPFEIRILLTKERHQYLFVSQRFVQAEVLSTEDLRLSRIVEEACSLGYLQIQDIVLLRRLAEDSNVVLQLRSQIFVEFPICQFARYVPRPLPTLKGIEYYRIYLLAILNSYIIVYYSLSLENPGSQQYYPFLYTVVLNQSRKSSRQLDVLGSQVLQSRDYRAVDRRPYKRSVVYVVLLGNLVIGFQVKSQLQMSFAINSYSELK